MASLQGRRIYAFGSRNEVVQTGDLDVLESVLITTAGKVDAADARLKPLSTSGSATPYHLPRADSPAVDDPLGSITDCPSYDQRFGPPRPLDGNGDGIAACDIGAIERDPLFQDGFEAGDTSRGSSPFPPQ